MATPDQAEDIQAQDPQQDAQPQDQPQDQAQPDNQVQPTAAPEAPATPQNTTQPVRQNVAQAATESAQGQKTGMFKNLLLGALKGLATGGIPGAIEGSISPKTASTKFQQQQDLNQAHVDQAKATVANTLAEATYKHSMADYYPAELKEKIGENGRQFALSLKAYGISPMLVTASDSPEHLEAGANQLMEDGRHPIIVDMGKGQYAAFDLAAAANTPADLPNVNLDRVMNGAAPYSPDSWMSKMLGPQARMQAMKHAQDFTHPTAKSLPEFDDKIARYQSYLDAVKSGKVAGLDDPEKAAGTMKTALDTLTSGHNQLMADLLKQKLAIGQTRFVKLSMSDGSERVMTGPEAVAFTRGSSSLVKDAVPVPGQANPAAPGQANPATPAVHAVSGNANNILQAQTPDGKQIAGTPSELQAAGIDPTTGTKLQANESGAVRASRQLIAPNGLFASIDKQMKALGPDKINIANSRINDFLAGKIGTGPEYVPLRNNLRLLSTRLMQVHVGLKGSDAMLDHFKEMFDSGKMDYKTLRSALAGGFEYANDRAMLIPKKQ